MTAMQLHELRGLLEQELRAAFNEAHASGRAIDPRNLVALVLERHRHRQEVRRHLAFLGSYLEAYVGLMLILSRQPRR